MIPTDWPPRFQPHDRVLDLLVGPQLYTSTDAAVRELLQNAEDACTLMAGTAGYSPRIVVRYSEAGNWCEFSDNGLGMNRESIQGSFAWIGAPKTEVEHIRQRIAALPEGQRQIAQFGIGILSCFGVASSIDLHTKMDSADPINLHVEHYRKPFAELPTQARERGTTIRLALKPDGPMKAGDIPAAVRKYARHTPHVWLADADALTEQAVPETWLDIRPEAIQTTISGIEAIIGGRLSLSPAWLTINEGFRTELVTCNGGFLVGDHDLDLLPAGATGFSGEVNIAPGSLTILMNREGFKRDEGWTTVSGRLSGIYSDLLSIVLDKYEDVLAEGRGPTDAIERGLLLMTRGLRGFLRNDVLQRADEMVGRGVTVGDHTSTSRLSLEDVAGRVQAGGTAYYVREGDGHQQRKKSFADSGGSSIQVTETVNTSSLRALQLGAAGYVVLVCRNRAIPHVTASGAQELRLHDVDVLSQYAGPKGFNIQSVNDAPPDLVSLAPLPESELISDIFEAGDGLRIVSLPTSSARVIPDYSGRLLNAAHPDIQALLKVIPTSVGNPVLRALIQTYIDLDNWEYERARQRLKALLDDPGLAEKMQLGTSPNLREYVQRRLQALRKEGPDA
jgi:hypothetical protein